MEKMQQTGIIRKVDELGRWVIPMEIRKSFQIKPLDRLEMFIGEDNEIILKKYQPTISVKRRLEDLIDTFTESNDDYGRLDDIINYLKEARKRIDDLSY